MGEVTMAVEMAEAGPPKCRLSRRDPLMACSLSMRMEPKSIFHKATCNTKPRPKLGVLAIHGILSEALMALQAITLMVSLGLVLLRKATTVKLQQPTQDGLTCSHGVPVAGVTVCWPIIHTVLSKTPVHTIGHGSIILLATIATMALLASTPTPTGAYLTPSAMAATNRAYGAP